MDQYNLGIQGNINLTSDTAEIFDRQVLQSNAIHSSSPSSAVAASTDLVIASASTSSTAVFPRGAASITDLANSFPVSVGRLALRSTVQLSIVSMGGCWINGNRTDSQSRTASAALGPIGAPMGRTRHTLLIE